MLAFFGDACTRYLLSIVVIGFLITTILLDGVRY
jgi:hypothetical protein